MKLNWKREILPIAIMVMVIIISIRYYPFLPDSVPIGFNAHGKATVLIGKNAFFLMWGFLLALPYLMVWLLSLDPLKHKIERKRKALFSKIGSIGVLILFLLELNAGLGAKYSINWYNFVMGILMIVVGNNMPRGPKTSSSMLPFMSSEIVQGKTNILSGWLFVITGFIFIIRSFCGAIP